MSWPGVVRRGADAATIGVHESKRFLVTTSVGAMLRIPRFLCVAMALVLATSCGGTGDSRPAPTPTGTAGPVPSPDPTATPTPTPPETVVWLAGCSSGPDGGVCQCYSHLFGEGCPRGVLARSADLGRTWSPTFLDLAVGSVTFLNRDRGWAVGYDGNRGVILRTDDGGATWADRSSTAELPPEATERGVLGLTAIRFLDDTRGVIVGTGVTAKNGGPDFGYLREGFVLRTEDGGASWRPASITSDLPLARVGSLSSVCFSPEGVALAAGNPPLLSLDGGATWTNIEERVVPDGSGPRWGIPQFAPQAAACLADGRLFLASSREVFGSEDYGLSWTLLSDPPGSALIPDLLFENPSSGWLAAGPLLRTGDGGRTWTEVDDGIPPPVAALSTAVLSSDDILVSSYNGVSVSADAGATWELFPVVNAREGVYSLEDIAVAK